MKVSLSTNDDELISYANTKREILSLPSQSNFRVYCLIIVSIADKSNLVEYVLIEGANCEQGYIGGAICAERSAIVQLRSLNSPKVCKIGKLHLRLHLRYYFLLIFYFKFSYYK